MKNTSNLTTTLEDINAFELLKRVYTQDIYKMSESADIKGLIRDCKSESNIELNTHVKETLKPVVNYYNKSKLLGIKDEIEMKIARYDESHVKLTILRLNDNFIVPKNWTNLSFSYKVDSSHKGFLVRVENSKSLSENINYISIMKLIMWDRLILPADSLLDIEYVVLNKVKIAEADFQSELKLHKNFENISKLTQLGYLIYTFKSHLKQLNLYTYNVESILNQISDNTIRINNHRQLDIDSLYSKYIKDFDTLTTLYNALKEYNTTKLVKEFIEKIERLN